jgi:hypothetical protein
MVSSRRGRIIELLNNGYYDEEVLKIIDVEFPPGTFSTSNKQALCGTKLDLGKSTKRSKSTTFKEKGNNRRSNTIEYSRSQLVDHLRCFNASAVIDHYYTSFLKGKESDEILRISVDKTIYRAFHYETPSKRYMKWRWHKSPDNLVEKLNQISIQEQYDSLLYDVAYSLVKDWGILNERGAPTRMNIGVALKIVNLIMKHLSFSDNTTNPHLIQWLHVPWDSYTLNPLRKIWHLNPQIPSNPAQGFVDNLELYKNLYTLINEIAVLADRPPIYYELLVWDQSHQTDCNTAVLNSHQ